ncbi:MAG: STAS domain-containing protein [Deltaproteobacteria bacterium]|nr:STAS domain-containing protein [Deltaproteobacteria bacterium]
MHSGELHPQDVGRIPIIRLADNLVVSIQFSLSDRLVAQLKDDVTHAIDSSGALGLVIDVSGVDLMDSYISRTIRDIALVARLMGVLTVICGVSPLVAITLVEMGVDLKVVRSALNLDAALELLQDLRREAATRSTGQDTSA